MWLLLNIFNTNFKVIDNNHNIQIAQIKEILLENISIATLNRELASLVANNLLIKYAKGRSTYYQISPYYKIISLIDISQYFIDNKEDKDINFNFEIFNILKNIDLLNSEEKIFLDNLKTEYQNNISSISTTLYAKELERLTIELSWKSSQIEGNTYSLLETERLFIEKEASVNKSKEEAIMLLNHKDALNYILEHNKMAKILNIELIEDIHYLLIKDLDISKNIRSRPVGVTGTLYRPIDNEHQIKDVLDEMCKLINSKDNYFEKSLLAILLISYIQPFEDGNKRTSRMLSNAILIANNACPLSYRNIDSLEYKKAMVIFYEQNNISAFKNIFIDQNIFAVKNYFA